MSAVAHNWDNHSLIGFVVGEDLLESLRQGVEVAISNSSVLKHFRLDLGKCQIARIYAVVSLLHAGTVLSLVVEKFISC